MNKQILLTALMFSNFQMSAMELKPAICPELQPIENEHREAYQLSLLMPQEVETWVSKLKKIKDKSYTNAQSPAILLVSNNKNQAALWPRAIADAMGEMHPAYLNQRSNTNDESNILLVRDLAALYTSFTAQLDPNTKEKTKIESFKQHVKQEIQRTGYSNLPRFFICGLQKKKAKEIPAAVLELFTNIKTGNSEDNSIVTLPTIRKRSLEIISTVMSRMYDKNWYLYDPTTKEKSLGSKRNYQLTALLARLPKKYRTIAIENLNIKHSYWSGYYIDQSEVDNYIQLVGEEWRQIKSLKS